MNPMKDTKGKPVRVCTNDRQLKVLYSRTKLDQRSNGKPALTASALFGVVSLTIYIVHNPLFPRAGNPSCGVKRAL